MAVTITATKYFTGTGPIKFSEIRDTFGDLPGSNVRLSDYKRNSTTDIDWNEDNTISPRVPDATENTQLPDIDENIQLQDYRNTIIKYDVEQSGNEEERVYSDGNTTDWNNNLSKNVNKTYDVTGTIYSNETSKYALTFEEGNYNNLYINVSGNIYGEGGSVGQNGGGALYLNNKYDGDKVTLDITNNGKIWAGGGGGIAGNAGNDGPDLACREVKNWVARNKYGAFSLCNPNRSSNAVLSSQVYVDQTNGNPLIGPNVKNGDGACLYPQLTCLAGSADPGGEDFPISHALNTNIPPRIIANGTIWNQATDYGGIARTFCRGSGGHGNLNTGMFRGGYATGEWVRGGALTSPIPREFLDTNSGEPRTWYNVYHCTRQWEMSCSGNQSNTVAGGTGGNGGTGGSGKGFTNRNVAMNASPHKGNDGNSGNTTSCNFSNMRGSSVGNDGNPGNSGGDWGQQAASGGSGGIAIHRKGVNLNGRTDDTVKGNVVNI